MIMLYLIGYTVGIFVCMLYLMIFANDAVKKRDGKWVWNYSSHYDIRDNIRCHL